MRLPMFVNKHGEKDILWLALDVPSEWFRMYSWVEKRYNPGKLEYPYYNFRAWLSGRQCGQ